MNRKLTKSQAQGIIDRVAAGEPQKNLAVEFEVSVATISKVVSGGSWPNLDRPSKRAFQRGRKLKETDIPIIRTRLANREKPKDVAADYDVTPQTIRDIANGKTWTHVPLPEPPKPTRRRVWER